MLKYWMGRIPRESPVKAVKCSLVEWSTVHMKMALFTKFVLTPDNSANSFKMLRIVRMDSMFPLAKIETSFAKNRWDRPVLPHLQYKLILGFAR